jgi:hypothetical protein
MRTRGWAWGRRRENFRGEGLRKSEIGVCDVNAEVLDGNADRTQVDIEAFVRDHVVAGDVLEIEPHAAGGADQSSCGAYPRVKAHGA